jgi:hypothetical protein
MCFLLTHAVVQKIGPGNQTRPSCTLALDFSEILNFYSMGRVALLLDPIHKDERFVRDGLVAQNICSID